MIILEGLFWACCVLYLSWFTLTYFYKLSLIEKNKHSTFDKYLWSINPNTLKIEINNNKNVGFIKKYVDNKVNIKLNDELFNNLNNHYTNFINKL